MSCFWQDDTLRVILLMELSKHMNETVFSPEYSVYFKHHRHVQGRIIAEMLLFLANLDVLLRL